MNRLMKSILVTSISIALLTSCSGSYIVKDSRGMDVAIDKSPKKVVVISSAMVSVLDELGVKLTATNELVPQIKRALKTNKDVQNIGSAIKPDFNAIKGLQPDIVVAGSMFANLAGKFEENQIPLWTVRNQTCDQMMQTIHDFGEVFDKKREAADMLEVFEKRKIATLAKYEGKTPPSVLIIWGTDNDYSFAKEKSFVGSIAEMLGCHNVVNDANFEEIIPGMIVNHDESQMSKLNPDVILRIYDGDHDKVWGIFKQLDTLLVEGGSWSHMNAAKNGRVYDLVEEGFAANPGLTMMDSFGKVANMLFDENYSIKLTK